MNNDKEVVGSDNSSFKKIIMILLSIIILVVAVVGISYAMFNFTQVSQANSITSGSISMNYTENSNGINLQKALPIKDDVGRNLNLAGEYFDFSVSSSSSGDIDIPYEISISEKNIEGNISKKNIKVFLTKIENGKETVVLEPTLLSLFETSSLRNDAIVLYKNIDNHRDSEIDTTFYRLRMWISYESDVSVISNCSYGIVVNVDASASIK